MTGVDIIAVSRVKKAAEKESFKRRVFTDGELEHCKKYKKWWVSLAGIFCAKEAVIKALKAGIGGADLKEIEVRWEGGGAPYAVLSGRMAELAAGRKAEISISHDGAYAVASAFMQISEK